MNQEFKSSDEDLYRAYVADAWSTMKPIPRDPEPLWNNRPLKQLKVGDRVSMEMPVYPSWWRRVFLREKPKTVMTTYEVTSLGIGFIVLHATEQGAWWPEVEVK